ncbi:MAG: sigma-54 dependent transcriptional regulator [Porticoccaceae bacterium]
MSPKIQQAVVFCREVTVLEKISELLLFLGCSQVEKAASAGQLRDYISHIESDKATVLFLKTADADELKRILEDVAGQATTRPVFVYQDDKLAVPPEVEKQCLGILSWPPVHTELIRALDDADIYLQSAENIHVDQFAPLFRSFAGNSVAIQQVRELIKQVAPSDATVLIQGESGSGKEVVARNIHRFSPRAQNSFVPVNCGAIPPDLLESELFGHEKGAFTGAISARQGRFEIADGGTLFLDEIGDMPLSMQVKLLRVLQESTFERVGSSRTIKVNVRIIAATHRNLEQLVAEGKFRMDLYYRLNVFPVEVPPLRERVSDIPVLIRDLVGKLSRERKGSLTLNECAVAALCKYYWPGNVRELANLIERLAILFPKKTIKWSDLPERFRPNQDWIAELETEQSPGPSGLQNALAVNLPEQGINLKNYLQDLEISLLTQALDQSGWVVARAAKLLGLQRTTLVEKMRKYALSRDDIQPDF